MPSFNFLKKLVDPDQAEAPDATTSALYPNDPTKTTPDDSIQTLRDIRQKQQTGLAPSVDPGSKGSGQADIDDISPIDIVAPGLAGAAGRGIVNVARAAPEILGNEAGVISSSGLNTRVGRALDLQKGNTLVDAAGRMISKDPTSGSLTGKGLIDLSGKSGSDYLKSLIQKANDMGIDITKDPELIQKLAGTNKTIEGLYTEHPNIGKLIGLNPDAIGSKYQEAGVLGHELQHGVEAANNSDLTSMLNQSTFDPKKLADVRQIMPNVSSSVNAANSDATVYQNGLDRAKALAKSGDVQKANDLVDALTQRHFAGYKNFEVENTLAPLVQTMRTVTPEEMQLIQRYPNLMQLLKR